jgi:hypothetical protein
MCPTSVSRSFPSPYVPKSFSPCLSNFADHYAHLAHNGPMIEEQTRAAAPPSAQPVPSEPEDSPATGYRLLATGYWLQATPCFLAPFLPAFLFPVRRFTSSLVHPSTSSLLHQFTSSLSPEVPMSLCPRFNLSGMCPVRTPASFPHPPTLCTPPSPFARPHPLMPFCETVKL